MCTADVLRPLEPKSNFTHNSFIFLMFFDSVDKEKHLDSPKQCWGCMCFQLSENLECKRHLDGTLLCSERVQVLTANGCSPHPSDCICIKLVLCSLGANCGFHHPPTQSPIFCLYTPDCSLLTHCFAFHVDSRVFVFTLCIAPSVQRVEARQVNADANRSPYSLGYGNSCHEATLMQLQV